LKFNGYNSTLECLEAEENTKRVITKARSTVRQPDEYSMHEQIPKMYSLFEGAGQSINREIKYENDLRRL